MQLNEIFHQVASDKASEGLRELAARSGLPENEIIIIAVNRMFHDVFHAGKEADRPAQDLVDDIRGELEFERHGRKVGKVPYPTDEELSNWESRGLIERRPEEKSQQLADFFKKHGVDD